MPMYMLLAKYTPAALKAIAESGSDREAVARKAAEAAGCKLHGFYGAFGQEYGMVLIIEAPGHAEYLGGVAPALTSGAFESYKTVPLYTWGDVARSMPLAQKVAGVYKPPAG
jgi:uncharacterized protein with GYD domain